MTTFTKNKGAIGFGLGRILCALLVTLHSNIVLANSPTDTLAKPPMRIVALAPHIVEMLYDIGAGDHIVGTVEYADFPEEAKKIPRIGGYYGMQIEKILALKPDLILAWKTGNKATDIEQIERLGLKVAYSAPEQIEDVAKELMYFGELTGYPAQAKKVAQSYLLQLKNIRQKYQDKAPIRVFYQLWPEPMMTVNKETWIHQLMHICQANNVFADNPTQYPQISIENVLVAAPELIIMPDEKSEKPQPVIQWQNWPEIPAVKSNQFVHVNADLLHRFSTRMLLGVESMCGKLDRFRQD